MLAQQTPPPEADQTSGCRGPTSQADAELVALFEQALGGEKSGWDGLVERYAGLVWAVARSLGLGTADATDVSQMTWLRLVENLDRIRQPERVGAWLATTARREALRLIRLSKRSINIGEDRGFDALVDDPPPIEDAPFMSADRHKTVAALLTQLPHRQQVILRLLSADDALSYREISDVLNIPIGSIGPTRARALESLHEMCVKAGITEF